MTARTAVLAAALLGLASPGGVRAQDVRGWSLTRFQMVQLRPLVQATFPVDQATRLPDGSFVVDGVPVTCSSTTCVRYAAGDVARSMVGTEDVGLTAWGLGVRGLSGTVLLRGRGDLGGAVTWPRSGDAFDVLTGYAQLDRSAFRLRLGRQQTFSSLGFSGFDGADVRWAPSRWLAAEAYGGRSLSRGLNEPVNEALQGLQDWVPDKDAYLVGGSLEARTRSGTSGSVRYERSIFADRGGLVSERASLALRTNLLQPVVLDGSVDWDVAFNRVGKAHLTARWAAPSFPLLLELTGRRYLPYFELSTIWGFFSPVPYSEVGLRATWAPLPTWQVWGSGAWRSYGDTHTATIFEPLKDTGYRVSLGAGGPVGHDLALEAHYDLDGAAGAFLSSGEATLAWSPDPRLRVSVGAQSFQQFEEFRLGEGRAWGGLAGARAGLTDRITLDGGLSVLHQSPSGGQVDSPWNQARAWTGLRITVGRDPGLSAGALRGGTP